MLKLLCRNANAFFSLILLAGLSACTLDVKILDKDGQSSKIAPPQNKTATITIAPSYINSNNQSILNLGGTCTGMSSLKVRIGTISTTANCNSSNWSTIIDVSALPDQTIQIVLEEPTSSTNLASLNIEKDTQVLAPASLNDMNFGTLASTARFKWSPIVDAASGVAAYEIAIGTTSGGTEILDWFDVGNLSEFSKAGLSGLSNGNTYYTSVRVKDLAGNVSSPTAGDGWLAIDKMKLASSPIATSYEAIYELGVSPTGSIFAVGAINGTGIQAPKAVMLNQSGGAVSNFTLGLGFDNRILTSAIQSDGKIVVGGWFKDFQGHECIGIARINTDGSRDTSFVGPSGASIGQYEKVKILPDGKILAAGEASNYNGVTVNDIVKLNSDGTLDSSFSVTFNVGSSLTNFEIQSDEKIIIIGDFFAVNGTARSHIARLNTDGSLDTTFDPGVGFFSDDWPDVLALHSDGKILVGGKISGYDGMSASQLVRINTDGSRDATFSTGIGIAGGYVYDILIDGFDIYIGGDFDQYNGVVANTLAKLSSNGSLNTTFSTNIGAGAQFSVQVLYKNSSGHLMVGGDFATFNGSAQYDLIWLNTDGSVALGYPDGQLFDWSVTTILETSVGSTFIGGWFFSYQWKTEEGVMKFDSNFNRDLSFSPLSTTGTINTLAFTTGDRIYLGGAFPSYGGLPGTARMVRVNSDGSRDSTFDIGTGFNNTVNKVTIQNNDGKAIVVGNFTTFKGLTQNRIARLNSDGSLDSTFNIGTGLDASAFGVTIQTDGKILVFGSFTTFNSLSANRLMRLNSDGSLDSTFNIGTGPDALVTSIVILPNGKLLVGGYFSIFNGLNYPSLVRLNADGSMDTSFVQHTFSSGVEEIETQSDGKILIVGDFRMIDSNNISLLARLNEDGSLDSTFLMGSGPSIDYSWGDSSSILNSVALLPNGEIIVGGDSTMSFDGKVSGSLYKLGW